VPRETDTPKWCFALLNGIRTTVVSLEPPRIGAGEGPSPALCGFEADLGNWWCGPDEERESGCSDDDGRCVTK